MENRLTKDELLTLAIAKTKVKKAYISILTLSITFNLIAILLFINALINYSIYY